MAYPRLTRRGQAVVGLTALAALLAWSFGGRTLNAVVVPAAALLAAGALQVVRAPVPEVSRLAPERGHAGDSLPMELAVDGSPGVTAALRDTLPAGLGGEATFDTVPDGRTLRYDLRLRHRGVHEAGPVEVGLGDFLGLWERVERVDSRTTVTVYPRVHPLRETADLLSGYVGLTDRREQFDSVREYSPGDPLRDVNWKASAKRAGELVVTEYAGEGATNRVTVGVDAPGQRTDAAAEAAASVAAFLLEAGLAVGLVTPGETVPTGAGEDHRRRLYGALASFDGGTTDGEADVRVQAPGDGTHVRVAVEGDAHRFGELLATDRDRSGGAPA
jgi:uncharacterized protein (DUF58 family)